MYPKVRISGLSKLTNDMILRKTPPHQRHFIHAVGSFPPALSPWRYAREFYAAAECMSLSDDELSPHGYGVAFYREPNHPSRTLDPTTSASRGAHTHNSTCSSWCTAHRWSIIDWLREKLHREIHTDGSWLHDFIV
jgi:hypothetical protein